MNDKNNKVAVFIGRFQPFHNGHLNVVKKAIDSKKYTQLIFVIGSSNQIRTPKNPFTFEERKEIILDVIKSEFKENEIIVNFVESDDFLYNDFKWSIRIVEGIKNVAISNNISLLGYEKDESSYYLNIFNMLKSDLNKNLEIIINATDIRKTLYSLEFKKDEENNKTLDSLNKLISTSTINKLKDFIKTDDFQYLLKENESISKNKEQYENGYKYAKESPFLTGDALVIHNNKVLLIKRKHHSGKGKWALAGGFFSATQDKTLVDAAIRELNEETNLINCGGISLVELKGCIKEVREFGNKYRSERGRIITTCAFIHIEHIKNEIKVKADDDASEVFWLPLENIKENKTMFFEDHLSIIDAFINIL